MSMEHTYKGAAEPQRHRTLPETVKKCEPVIHPTQHNVVESTEVIITPEVFPVHTTYVKNRVNKRVLSSPHTESVKEKVHDETVVEGAENGKDQRRGLFDRWF
ncbi:CotD family spore coat protein [Shouchella shacheensis]|uniref:CotD family spore coat protein n=1 Tax=Shouchella shacheensis TaxID=1649580 RepID=UPI00073FF295|nr:CotD family spore coat protein [Shouchella shacheensis]